MVKILGLEFNKMIFGDYLYLNIGSIVNIRININNEGTLYNEVTQWLFNKGKNPVLPDKYRRKIK